ncbi:hypothetical protein SEPCBS119000_001634 [Sporothrix epigloea]|uniref:SHSP domain-containing protein n=1 Tax=Sporothrix epigloea TaxID=1892477 RepID=A0ABP0DDG0_9PEZI
MPFYQNAFFHPAAADQFTNIFQLFNDIDGYQQQAAKQQEAYKKAESQARQQQCQAPCASRKSAATQRQRDNSRANCNRAFEDLFGLNLPVPAPRAFSPRFDVRETESSYELHGELAGVDRKNISLVFTEPQTLEVTGSVERKYTLGAPASSSSVEAAPETVPEAIADTHSETSSNGEPTLRDGARTPNEDDEFTEIVAPRTPSPARSHRATVTDEATEEALERGEDITNDKSTAKAEVADPDVITPDEIQEPQQKVPTSKERFLVQERCVGQFKRVFNFPVPVDEANVRAHMENGILSVSIPKARREVRRIVVF